MASQAELEPARKRQRKAKSCQPCRDRKVRCDQASPCGPCLRSRDNLKCTYRDVPHDLGPTAVGGGVGGVGGIPTAATHGPLVALNSLVGGGGGWTAHNIMAHPPTSTVSYGIRTARPQEMVAAPSFVPDAKVKNLETRLRRLEDEVAAAAVAVRQPAVENGPSINAITPRLRITAEKVKLFGPSHWVHAAEKAYKFGSFDAGAEPTWEFDKREWSRICTDLRKLRHAVKLLQQPDDAGIPLQLAQLVETLPSRQVCDMLIGKYVHTFETIYRIVNVAQFKGDVEQFWEERTEASRKPTFILILVLVLAVGLPFLSEGEAGLDEDALRQLRLQARLWIYAAQWWLTGPTDKSTQNLNALQIFCLAIIARQVNGLGGSPALSATSLASLAVQMGLNKDPHVLVPGMPRSQAECMARLWATITELLLASHLESGIALPGMVEDSDVKKPSNINDFELKDGPETTSPPPFQARTTDVSIHLLLLKSQKLRIQALRVINSTQTQVSYDEAVSLANQLRLACSEVTKFFNERKSELKHRGTTDFSRNYIDMYLRRHILLLHRPFMLIAQKDPRFYLSHKMCVESAMIMASYTDGLNLPSQPIHDFAKLMMQGSGHWRGGLTLDVAMTLALELNASLQEEDGHGDGDPAQALSRELRQPFLQRLTHIRDQLFQIIKCGIPSMKRYLMISSFLAQFEALETGANAKAAFFNAILQGAESCRELLQNHLEKCTPQTTDASSEAASSVDTVLNLGEMDFENLFDPVEFFDPVTWSKYLS